MFSKLINLFKPSITPCHIYDTQIVDMVAYELIREIDRRVVYSTMKGELVHHWEWLPDEIRGKNGNTKR